jgi:acyl-CoA reductase-like NAD-dependent aldehyde dehydrogenase
MSRLTDQEIEAIARKIVADLGGQPAPKAAAAPAGMSPDRDLGIFATVDEAVKAAKEAQPKFVALPLSTRAKIIAELRRAMLDNASALAKAAFDETHLGRFEDKIVKNQLVAEKTPGLEHLYPEAITGDRGLALIEPAPYGVICAITPCTNPTSTIICNTIGMIAAGNTVVFNVHPTAKNCSMQTVALINKTIVAAGGPRNVVNCLSNPTVESAQAAMKHPDVKLVVVTGGGGVVKAAMASGKRAICAGPGNPPVVVDETADIENAARCIVAGASTDNNIICVDEKETIVVASVADELIKAMQKHGAALVDKSRAAALQNLVFKKVRGPREEAEINRDLIGKNADFILGKIGMSVPSTVRLAIVEVDENDPMLWTEQMMPVMPICRVPNADYAIDLALKVEGGNRHTAVMHSRNIDKLHRMAKECDCSIFVKNGRAQAGLGLEGEGYTSFTIASPTGDGLTGPRTFSRWRRCTLVDHFRIT